MADVMTPEPELLEPLPDLSAWADHFRRAEIAVLGETADALEGLRAAEDRNDANSIGELISGDPLMALKVLIHASAERGPRVVTRAQTVTGALVMTGITPFFRAFGPQPRLEDRLADRPEVLAGLMAVMGRAHRGAGFALAFAVHRADPAAAAIHAAALLHEFAELLLWLHAPELALRIQQAQAADPSLRSGVAQLAVLHVDLTELQETLVAAWQLPTLLAEPAQPGAGGFRTVALAARLARHTAHGWDNAALPDDIADIAELLNLAPDAALALAKSVEPA